MKNLAPSRLKILFATLCFLFVGTAQAASLYEILGVKTNTEANEIKSTWKSLVRKHHPDRFMGDPEAMKSATEKLALINAAETVLGDSILRAYYDFLSNEGKNHERWERFSGNTNLKILNERLGPVDQLKARAAKQNPFASASENKSQPSPQSQNRPQAKPSPSPSPEPHRKEAPLDEWTEERILQFLGDPRASDHDWKFIRNYYVKKFSSEKNITRQVKWLNLLASGLPEWKIDAVAELIVLKFEIADSRTTWLLTEMVHSQHEHERKAGLSLLFYALAHERSYLFEMDTTKMKAWLLSRVNDPAPAVREKASKAAVHFYFQKAAPPAGTILQSIKDLSSPNFKIQEEAFRALLTAQNFETLELKALTLELLRRQKALQMGSSEKILQEMKALLEILGRNSNLQPVAKELKIFATVTQRLELRTQAHELIQRYRCESVFKF